MKRIQLLLLILLFTVASFSDVFSQDSLRSLINSLIPVSPFTISGYVDTYYSHDNDNSNTTDRFPGVSPVRDEFRLNIAQLSLKYIKQNVRGNLTIQYGDLPDVSYPSNQKLFPEANVGFSPWENVWIDAGYFVTHIGTETVRPIENTFSTWALVTQFEPLPQAGAVISYSARRFNGALWVMNGYSVLADNNKNKSAGISLTWWPYKNVSFAYNNIIGNESSDLSDGKMRYYNNFIIKASLGTNWNIIVNNDFCFQEKSKIDDPKSYGALAGGFLTVQYTFNDPKFSLAYRGEYFADFDGILSPTYNVTSTERSGLMCFGPSLAFKYQPMPNAYVRLEGRYLKTLRDLKIFTDDKDYRIDGSITMGVQF
ncbi:MAG: porin [Bacteroidetes bacterium]|nr:porin [Bacteroidota bacterium]